MWRYSLIFIIPITILFSQQDNIIFPHQFHIEDVELECSMCHSGIEQSTSLEVRFLPEMETCTECHEIEDDCSLCHTNPEEPLPTADSYPASGMEFSHSFHLTKKKDCSACHGYIYEDDGSGLPKSWKENDCRECHIHSHPESHTLDWTKLHGAEVNIATKSNCGLCHTETSCDQCHQLQEFEPENHPSDYLMTHGFDFRSGITDCSTCHDLTYDCRSCHEVEVVMPMDHNMPDWAGEFLDDGGMHSDAAMDEPETCQVCHEPAVDNTCLRCHE